MLNDIAIPILPCRNSGETLHFNQRPGFAIGSRENAPDSCGIVRRDGSLLRIGQPPEPNG